MEEVVVREKKKKASIYYRRPSNKYEARLNLVKGRVFFAIRGPTYLVCGIYSSSMDHSD
jgi:hypothetical protein